MLKKNSVPPDRRTPRKARKQRKPGVVRMSRAHSVSPDDLRKWVKARRRAAERETEELQRVGPRPRQAIQQALSLMDLAGELNGGQLEEDELSREQDRKAYQTWARLRRNWRGKTVGPR